MRPRIVVATGNAGKLKELSVLLASTGYDLVAQRDAGVAQIPETGLSFVENAILKARNAAQHTGLPALAEDSGLEVDALDGQPGIYSARYAGAGASDECNVQKLLTALAGQPDRRARFRCVAVVMRHATDPAPLICAGMWPGDITRQPAGDNGFGYDPVFRPDGFNVTAAQLDAAVKNAQSHRARAMAKLVAQLPAFLSL